MRFLVLSGLSGAGKTTAKGFLEDLGYFMVDNLPPRLWKPLLEELAAHGKDRAGVVLDARALDFFGDLEAALKELHPVVVFLEARPEILLRRYNLTRRLHPLGTGNLTREIQRERQALSPLREKAHLILDTSDLSPRALREALARLLGEEAGFRVRLLSFGFKWGPPQEADLVLDVRALPNPHYDPELRPKTGLDPEVRAYVFQGETEAHYRALLTLAGLSAEGARKEGRAFYTIAIGCTGGRHRSVAVAERLAEDLSGRFTVEVSHRDVEREA
ncbi:nucleotide-binding protein [Thermus composti]|uniref:RNase adapter RapZ n=1 Tax=Thermus composti TaxID=532059 RepID=A0ABV6PY67_9DEIN|nr:RNase adapter RapZ [Thermus composti]GGM92497.1 nucleotide-binding protein [Thermus composti]